MTEREISNIELRVSRAEGAREPTVVLPTELVQRLLRHIREVERERDMVVAKSMNSWPEPQNLR